MIYQFIDKVSGKTHQIGTNTPIPIVPVYNLPLFTKDNSQTSLFQIVEAPMVEIRNIEVQNPNNPEETILAPEVFVNIVIQPLGSKLVTPEFSGPVDITKINNSRIH